LRHRPMAMHAGGWLMVHAGVLPEWTTAKVLELASEVERALRQPDFAHFLIDLYGDLPDRWHDNLQGSDRLRVIVNALTRIRFCSEAGAMEFKTSKGADAAPPGFVPWFDVPGRATSGTPIAFGHWSALVSDQVAQSDGFDGLRGGALALDTGCVWGNCLSAARLGSGAGEFELISVRCSEQADPKHDQTNQHAESRQ
jgi:bis(5'-nucleosyl)-tetraphosphatase (symmetrical)